MSGDGQPEVVAADAARSGPVYNLITRELGQAGVSYLFGLVGEDTVLFTADMSAAGIRYVGSRHEAGAVAMADGYAWATGEVGVCTVTRGPGMMNALTACRSAVQGRRRVLIVTGDIPLDGGGPFYKNIDQERVCESVGLDYYQASSAAAVVSQLHRALAAAREGRPSVLAVPADILNGTYRHEDLISGSGQVISPPQYAGTPNDVDIDRLVGLLSSAARPLLLAGLGACSEACRDLLTEIAGRTGALVGTTLLAKGLFRGSSFDLGVIGGFSTDAAVPFLADVDLVVAFGASLSPYTTAHGSLFREIPVVQVVNDPARIAERTRVDVSIVADAEETCRLLADALPLEPPPDAPFHREDVLTALTGPVSTASDRSTVDELDPGVVATILNELLPADRVIVLDSGRFATGPGRFIAVREPGSIRHTADGGSIGLGLGVAMGAAIGRPDRTNVLFAGDGGFSMALADLETAARHHLALVMVVMDDRQYGSELRLLDGAGLPGDTAALPQIDFVAVAAALGIEAFTVRTVDDLNELAPRLLNRRAPILLHCLIRRDVTVPRLTWPVNNLGQAQPVKVATP